MADGVQVEIVFVGALPFPTNPEILRVDTDADYLRAAQELSGLGPEQTLELQTRARHYGVWLENYCRQIGRSCVLHERTARDVLGAAWNVTLPSWLQDADVLEYKLLDLEVPTTPHTSFAARLLAEVLGSEAAVKALNRENFAEVMNAVVAPDHNNPLYGSTLFNRALEEQTQRWATESDEAWARSVAPWIATQASELWSAMSCLACLHSYPAALLERVVGPQLVPVVRSIPPNALGGLTLKPDAREECLVQQDLLFKQLQQEAKPPETIIEKALEWASGLLRPEFERMLSLIQTHKFAVKPTHVDALKASFKDCPGVSRYRLARLDRMVKPARPRTITHESEMSPETWIDWTLREYLPYRSWQMYNGVFDEQVEETVQRFSNWYYNNYVQIQSSVDKSLVYSLNPLAETERKDELSLVLMVDALPLEYHHIMEQALRSVGLQRHGLSYRFAALPTATAYNKPAILRGHLETTETSYPTILKKRSNSDWDDKPVLYLNSIKAVAECEGIHGPTVIVVNITDGDEILHSDLEARNTTHDEELSRLYRRLAEAVDALITRAPEAAGEPVVHLVTDHGACRTLPEESTTFDSKVVSKLFSDEKYRFACMSPEQANAVPENLWEIGYRFDRSPRFPDEVFFLPRGHNSVRKSHTVAGYLHGGLTPEEVIVATGIYKPVPASWKKPFLRFPGLEMDDTGTKAKFYVQRVVELAIEVQNPNNEALEIRDVRLLEPAYKPKGLQTAVVQPAQSAVVTLNVYFEQAAKNSSTLQIEISYTIGGESHTMTRTEAAEFRSAMSGGLDLRNL